MTQKVFILDDDLMMAECIERAVKLSNVKTKIFKFTNILDAMNKLNQRLPDLIIMDIMLSGPNGLSFLNELSSYSDTNCIPVIITTYLNIDLTNLTQYNVQKVLNKETMTPPEIAQTVNNIFAKEKIENEILAKEIQNA